MKKIVIFLVAALLVFSVSSFSPDKPHKKTQSAKIEQGRKKNTKAGIKPRKSRSRKGVHKSKSNRQPKRHASRNIMMQPGISP